MNTVEEFFIRPLIEHFEDEPPAGSRDTIENDMSKYSAEDLHEAVEILKRSRQSMTSFPSPKECIKAMTVVVGGRTSKVVPAPGKGKITKETYAACANAFCAGMKEIPVIKEGTPQWESWFDYWRWLDVKWVIDLVITRQSFTVPTEFPEQFDPRYKPMQRAKAAA